jgi:predicted nucleic-acid-binding Zn-ribbon protein
MSENNIKTCPKCGGMMEKGSRLFSYGGVSFAKKGDFVGDRIIPYYCRACGYIEL